jgi:hypothetical protein
MNKVEPKQILNYSLKWGAIMGLAVVVVYLMVYLLHKTSLVSYWFGGLNLVLPISFIFYAMYSWRKENDNQMSFNEGFRIGILMYAGGSLITIIFQYLLYNVIDRDLHQFIFERTIQNTTELLQNLNASEEDIEKALDSLDPEKLKLTPANLIQNYLFGLLMGGIISPIGALIFRRNNISSYTN